MNSLTVNLGERSYPIYFAEEGIERLPELFDRHFSGTRLFFVSNETIAALYRNTIESVFASRAIDSCFITIPDGEDFKTLTTAEQIFSQLIRNNADRRSVIVGFGGGVVGDIAGFVAASYMRGVPFVQVPTSLLAMVDSSVGGKVAVNHALGKNMIGAFYQPKFVFIDHALLKTLPKREWLCGFAEILKYGLILDAEFFEWTVRHAENILSLDRQAVDHAIRKSCELKSQIIEKDEKENDLRRILNFGHTWGHAFEHMGSYRILKHGEAVLLGMLAAAHLSWISYRLNDKDFKKIEAAVSPLLQQVLKDKEMTDLMKAMTWSDIWSRVQSDKKAQNKEPRWILLNRIGEAVVDEGVKPETAEKSFIYLQSFIQKKAYV